MRCLFMLLLALAGLLSTGCSSGGQLKLPSGTVITPPKQSEQPTQVTESKASQTLSIPAGSTIQVVHTPATPSAPESTQTTYTISKDTQQSVQSNSQTISLSPTRKPDTTVELHRADLAERRWLLFVGIGLGVAGIALRSLLPAWPGLSTGCFGGAVLALAAWKLAEIPAWIFLCVIGVVGLLALGYKKGNIDKDGDGVPDILQRR